VKSCSGLALILISIWAAAPAGGAEPLPALPQGQTIQIQRTPQQGEEPKDEHRARLEREMEKKANQERFANLKRDTDKLLQLATELKQNVDKANEHTLSLDVLKKAEEIEKLAKSVKEKMRGY
jgi:hypothetical protein